MQRHKLNTNFYREARRQTVMKEVSEFAKLLERRNNFKNIQQPVQQKKKQQFHPQFICKPKKLWEEPS
jgi:hypothetical protein